MIAHPARRGFHQGTRREARLALLRRWKGAYSVALGVLPKHFRAQPLHRYPGELGNLPGVLCRDRLPLRYGGGVKTKVGGKLTLLSPVGFEICDKLFHAPIFSQNEFQSREKFQSKLIFMLYAFG